jgi:hypothetical protein
MRRRLLRWGQAIQYRAATGKHGQRNQHCQRPP